MNSLLPLHSLRSLRSLRTHRTLSACFPLFALNTLNALYPLFPLHSLRSLRTCRTGGGNAAVCTVDLPETCVVDLRHTVSGFLSDKGFDGSGGQIDLGELIGGGSPRQSHPVPDSDIKLDHQRRGGGIGTEPQQFGVECDFFRTAQSGGKFGGIGSGDGYDDPILCGSDIFSDRKEHRSGGIPVIACVELPAVVKLQMPTGIPRTVSEPQFDTGVHAPGDFCTF